MITVRQKGDFSKTEQYLRKLKKPIRRSILDKYGQAGVAALASATPKDSGETANAWSYEIIQNKSNSKIEFKNSHVNKGVPIAIILQYGHGTGTGGWVEGRDYINPAIQPIFDAMAKEVWREVTRV